jgi:hypothetical protein
MTSPSLELQGAIVARLKGASPVTGIVAQRIYDAVPAVAAFPYVSFGPSDELSDDADCITGFEVTMQLDGWSRSGGFTEARSIADAVRTALHGYEFNLSSNALVLFEHRVTRMFRDPDGITSHAAMTFTALVEQPEILVT